MDEQARKEILNGIDAHIKRYGWTVMGVFNHEGKPPLAYTVGFEETLQHPEIIMSGLQIELMHALLNVMGHMIQGGQRFEDGQLVSDIIEKYPVKFIDVPFETAIRHLTACNAHYPKEIGYRTLQCVLPQKDGQFQATSDDFQMIFSTQQNNKQSKKGSTA